MMETSQANFKKSLALQVATDVINQHFLYFDDKPQTSKTWKKCDLCIQDGNRRRFKYPTPKLMEQIEEKLIEVQISMEEPEEDNLRVIARDAIHRWIEHETELTSSRSRVFHGRRKFYNMCYMFRGTGCDDESGVKVLHRSSASAADGNVSPAAINFASPERELSSPVDFLQLNENELSCPLPLLH